MRTSIVIYTRTLWLLLRMTVLFLQELHHNSIRFHQPVQRELAEGTRVLEGEKVTFLVYKVKQFQGFIYTLYPLSFITPMQRPHYRGTIRESIATYPIFK